MAYYSTPELWVDEIVELLSETLVGEAVCNTNLTGQISRRGDKLHIITGGEVSIAEYPASDNITYSDPTDTDSELSISLDQYFALKFEDDDDLQSSGLLRQASVRRGINRLRDYIDAQILAEYANAGLDSYETGSTAWQFTIAAPTDVINLFDSINYQLDGANAPQAGRFLIVPANGMQAIRRYFAGRATQLGDTVLQNGFVGQVMGLDLYMSNNCTSGHGLAGVKQDNIALAIQIKPENFENVRLEGRFADGVRGRLLAGIKTYRTATLIDVNLNTTIMA